MKEKYLFLNTYYFNISQEKERNRAILDQFLFNTNYDTFSINSYVIALSLFTDQKNYKNDIFNPKDYDFLNNILDDFFKGNNNQFIINREQLNIIVELCNSYRLSMEYNERVIKGIAKYDKKYQQSIDILLDINKQI